MLNLADLNTIDADDFTRAVGCAFEHSPWVAARSAPRRPFANREQLHAAMCDTVRSASDDEKLALIRAHPDLVGRAVLTTESQSEQSSAGLGDLALDEIGQFERYNREYRDRFDFPFVICARLNKKEAILRAFPERLAHSPAKEIETALEEIFKIAELRLRDLVP
jgi:2-oxo-4-hydroxy-4-carboxy-5-ureidoimidazoline decarboxylase